MIAVDVTLPCGATRVIVVYSPSKQRTVINTGAMVDMLRNWSKGKQRVIICGDFNMSGIKWAAGKTPQFPKKAEKAGKGGGGRGPTHGKLFLDLIKELRLTQYVLEPTHNKNILDLVLANKGDLVTNLVVHKNSQLGRSRASPTTPSDHNKITFDLPKL